MPIQTLDLTKRLEFPTAQGTLSRELEESVQFGTPQERFDIKPAPSWTDVLYAQMNMFGINAEFETWYRMTEMSPDFGFNPYTFIRENKELREDREVMFFAEHGQLDDSYSIEELYHNISRGREFMKDMETMQRSSFLQFWSTMPVAMFSDPLNYIPLGAPFTVARKAKLLKKLIARMAVGGGTVLAFEKLQNYIQPLSNEPGLLNEAMATGLGMAFGVVATGLGGTPTIHAKLGGWKSTRKLNQMADEVTEVLKQPIVERVSPDRITTDAELTHYPFQQAFDEETVWLQSILDNDIDMSGRTLPVLMRKGDIHEELLMQINEAHKARASEAGGAAPRTAPAAVPVPEPTGPKQPWEMTQEEWLGGGNIGSSRMGESTVRSIVSPTFSGDNAVAEAHAWAKSRGLKEGEYTLVTHRKRSTGEVLDVRVSVSGLGMDVKTETLAGPYARHKMQIKRALKEGKPVPDAVLREYPDLRGAPEAAGAPARTVDVGDAGPVGVADLPRSPLTKQAEHPNQELYDDAMFMQDILGHPNLAREADIADIEHSVAAKLWRPVTKTYVNMQRTINPGGRIMKVMVGAVQETARTLGHFATYTKASADDSLHYSRGTDADSVRLRYHNWADMANLMGRKVYKDMRRRIKTETGTKKFAYDGETYDVKLEQVNRVIGDYMHKRQSKHRYPEVRVPDDVPPEIKTSVDGFTDYFNKMLVEAEKAGEMKIGPRAVEAAKREVTALRDEVEVLKDMAHDIGETDLVNIDSYNIKNINDTINQMHESLPNPVDQIEMMRQNEEFLASTTGHERGGGMEESAGQPGVFPITPDNWRDMTAAQRQKLKRTAGSNGIDILVNEDGVASFTDNFGDVLYDQVLDQLSLPIKAQKLELARKLKRSAGGPTALKAQLYEVLDDLNHYDPHGVKGMRRDMVDPADIPDGTHFTVYGEDATVRTDPVEGRIVEIGDMEYGVDELAAVPVEINSVAHLLDLPRRKKQKNLAKKTGTKAKRLEKRAVAREEGLEKLEEVMREKKDHVPIVWNIEAMLAHEEDWLRMISEDYRIGDSMVGGVVVEPDARPLIASVAQNLDSPQRIQQILDAKTGAKPVPMPVADEPRPPVSIGEGELGLQGKPPEQAMREAEAWANAPETPMQPGPPVVREEPTSINEIVRDLTEGDLPESMRAEYRARLKQFYDHGAQSAFNTIARHTTDRHGVTAHSPISNPFKHRVLNVNYSRFVNVDVGQPGKVNFIETNIETIITRYDRVAGGRLAVRRAIKSNPYWEGKTWTSPDGVERPIESGADLKGYIESITAAFVRMARKADKHLGTDGRKALTPHAERMHDKLIKNFGTPIDMMEGRSYALEGPAWQAALWFGRTVIPLTYANKLGSVLWAQFNDLAPMTLYAVQRPTTLRYFIPIIKGLAPGGGGMDAVSVRDMQTMGIFVENMTRTKALVEADNLTTVTTGIGHGRTKRATAWMEEKASVIMDVTGRASGMNFFTNFAKQFAAMQMIDRVTIQSKWMLKVDDLVRGGMTVEQAVKKVGRRWNMDDLRRLNNLGMEVKRAKRYHDLVWEHGLTPSDEPVRSAYKSFDDYMNSNKLVKPNFAEWKLKGAEDIDMMDILMSNMTGDVHRAYVVTPGPFDKPLINTSFGPFGKMINQFQAFGMAFVNQRLAPMAQMPLNYQAWYAMSYFALGGISDAVASHLSGRRSIGETAELWADPATAPAMFVVAMERSGMLGWWGRPLSVLEHTGFKWTPDNYRTMSGTSASRHIQPGKEFTYLGPAFSDMSRAYNILMDLANLSPTTNTAYNAWKLIPTQNLWLWRAIHKSTGLPIIPEALMEERWAGMEPQP